MRLAEHRYRTVTRIAGQLLFVDQVDTVMLGEVVTITGPDGRTFDGEVLEIEKNTVLVQLYGNPRGLDCDRTSVVFSGGLKRIPLALDLLGRSFSGSFSPIDGLPMFLPTQLRELSQFPLNPVSRKKPEEFIETGISAIDGLNTLVKGQKLPIFSCSGLPAKELVAQILKNADQGKSEVPLAVIFVALGLTYHEYAYYKIALGDTKAPVAAFINMADDPVMERLLAPRIALTVAEYLAYDKNMDVLVLISDMVNYCDALREISNTREELPGRRGYPGYMYSDLASLYEKAGRIHGFDGSITILPVVTMPEDDITHPIPDLTGYITEGQIVLSRLLHQQGIFPPIDVLPSLSRLMQNGIGERWTRKGHRQLTNQLFRMYARGRELRKLESIVGRDGMLASDCTLLEFAAAFEKEFINQNDERRTIGRTLDLADELLDRYPVES